MARLIMCLILKHCLVMSKWFFWLRNYRVYVNASVYPHLFVTFLIFHYQMQWLSFFKWFDNSSSITVLKLLRKWTSISIKNNDPIGSDISYHRYSLICFLNSFVNLFCIIFNCILVTIIICIRFQNKTGNQKLTKLIIWKFWWK